MPQAAGPSTSSPTERRRSGPASGRSLNAHLAERWPTTSSRGRGRRHRSASATGRCSVSAAGGWPISSRHRGSERGRPARRIRVRGTARHVGRTATEVGPRGGRPGGAAGAGEDVEVIAWPRGGLGVAGGRGSTRSALAARGAASCAGAPAARAARASSAAGAADGRPRSAAAADSAGAPAPRRLAGRRPLGDPPSSHHGTPSAVHVQLSACGGRSFGPNVASGPPWVARRRAFGGRVGADGSTGAASVARRRRPDVVAGSARTGPLACLRSQSRRRSGSRSSS